MTSTEADQPSPPAVTASHGSGSSAVDSIPNVSTPKTKPAEGAATTPKSAPAAGARYRTTQRPGQVPPPTLLVDFLRGRPSPARLSAKRQRRASIDAVKAEIQHEMRISAIRKVQQPGGVKDRVKAWQKAYADAMANGDPAAAPSEPTVIAFAGEENSVTEEDRVRIKLRRKKTATPKEAPQKPSTSSSGSGTQPESADKDKSGTQSESTDKDKQGTQSESADKEKPGTQPESADKDKPGTPMRRQKPPPKKRVVSDDHWMDKKKKRSPPRLSHTSKRKVSQPRPMPIPKDFLQRTAANPPASQKVRAWAEYVENHPPDDSPFGVRQRARASRSGDFDEDVDSLIYDDGNTHTDSYESSARPRSRTWKPARSETEVGDDDGIRVTPIRDDARRREDMRTNTDGDADSIPSIKTDPPPDDGIRVRPIPEASAGESRSGRKHSNRKKARKPSRTMPSVAPSMSLLDASPYDLVQEDDACSQGKSDELSHDPETPTRRKVSRSKPRMGRKPRASAPTEITDMTQTTEATEATESTEVTETTGADFQPRMMGGRSPGGTSLESRVPDDMSTTISLAEIPFGKSAFSELDLPLGADARNSSTKKKPQRNASFSATKVFKKVVSEGKKMIHETADPPKTHTNTPPSIEKWLTHTVDPFVDAPLDSAPNPAQTRKSVEQKWAEEDQARQPDKEESARKASPQQEAHSATDKEDDEDATSKNTREMPKTGREEVKRPQEAAKRTPPPLTGLKRKGATRGGASPVKTGTGRFLRAAFKDAFKGQSANQIFTQTSYESREERTYTLEPSEIYYYEDEYPPGQASSSGQGSHRRQHSPDSYDSRDYDSRDYDSRDYDDDQTTSTSSLPELRRLPPPTNGLHELSTIVSAESYSSYGDDTLSYGDDTLSHLSQTTITQTTAFTGGSELSRQSSQKSGSGLKRRLTKHSDLVSVLSAPGDGSVPQSVRNSRSRPSVRRTRNKQDTITIDDLLHEFEDDESLYNRELKALVDGVIPVLLNHAVSESADLLTIFGTNSPGRKVDIMSKAVVGMGISLEKIRNAHRRAPLTDIYRLVHWLHGVESIYSEYLKAWRLGFENLVVNLAPASDTFADDDSLLNALPLNDDGDIIDADGERVDVAHLLRRPLFRIKMMTKFVKGVHSILDMESTQSLVLSFDALQEQARRRHKEERARATDEEAANTDATRTRDLRTLAPLGYIKIDPSLQVNAKDHFDLSVHHSNGQRMECQVELVYRDKPNAPNHPGDLLIRQTKDGRRSWLLFPPIPLTLLSARRSDLPHELVVMVQGTHNGKQWHELVWLSSDDEIQIREWLDILGTVPVPPLTTDAKAPSPEPESPQQRLADVPVGERSIGISSPISDEAPPSPKGPRPPAPTRYKHRDRDQSPLSDNGELSEDDDQLSPKAEHSEVSQTSIPDIEIVPAETGEEAPSTTPYREDGAPPPPVHRTISRRKKGSLLLPPADTRVKRRTSSPLKHEYLPSEGSSESEFTDESGSETATDLESDSESDDTDSVDIPDTEVGYSIRKESELSHPLGSDLVPPAISELSPSVMTEDSITPSHSASQVGVNSKWPGASPESLRFMCSVSHWSDKKGTWKDLSKELSRIIVSPGRMEAFSMTATDDDRPLIALDLTPLVLIRKSNALDFEVRTALMEHSKLLSIGGGMFRFRNATQEECLALYAAAHDARLKNEKYIKLENEKRFKSFGERRPAAEGEDGEDGSTSSRRRSWFGRRNSYRASARAPARSHEDGSSAPSSASASSFLKRLTGGRNMSFNIRQSSVENQSQSRPGSFSFYTSSGDSSGEGSTPRSPSVSINDSWRGGKPISPENIPIRLHLLASASKWEDYGNCRLQVRRPPEGWRQELRANHGLEKRVTVTTVPKKNSAEGPQVILDAVLGSGCFSMMGTRGIVCSVWEEMRDEFGRAGVIPQTSSPGGSVKKWCFQLGGVGQAGWLLTLLHEEVVRA